VTKRGRGACTGEIRCETAHARTGRALAALASCIAFLACTAAFAAEGDGALERQVKAAFIYQFIPYVEWPPRLHRDAESPVVVAVAGPESVVADLEQTIGNRTAKGRPVVVRRWRDNEGAGAPHILFVTRSEASRLPAIARSAQANGTLVVSEQENGLDQGSMINFRLVEGRVRFDVALAPAERAGLRISARLLTVAQSVRPAG
jgi:hypothetical protein